MLDRNYMLMLSSNKTGNSKHSGISGMAVSFSEDFVIKNLQHKEVDDYTVEATHETNGTKKSVSSLIKSHMKLLSIYSNILTNIRTWVNNTQLNPPLHKVSKMKLKKIKRNFSFSWVPSKDYKA